MSCLRDIRKYLFSVVLICLAVFSGVSPVEAKWVPCQNRKVWVGPENLSSDGTNFYYADNKDVIIEDQETGRVRVCVPVGPGMQLMGTTVVNNREGETVVVLVVSEPGNKRFFDIATGNLVFVETTDEGDFVLNEEPTVWPGTKITILNNWYGAQSRIKTPEFRKIIFPKDWEELWHRHKDPGAPVPAVDFSRNMVVAILLGQRVNSGGVRLLDAREEEELVFYFDQMSFRPRGDTLTSQPVGFFVVPQTKKKVIFKERIPGDKLAPFPGR